MLGRHCGYWRPSGAWRTPLLPVGAVNTLATHSAVAHKRYGLIFRALLLVVD
jgi:hypothetical protein